MHSTSKRGARDEVWICLLAETATVHTEAEALAMRKGCSWDKKGEACCWVDIPAQSVNTSTLYIHGLWQDIVEFVQQQDQDS